MSNITIKRQRLISARDRLNHAWFHLEQCPDAEGEHAKQAVAAALEHIKAALFEDTPAFYLIGYANGRCATDDDRRKLAGMLMNRCPEACLAIAREMRREYLDGRENTEPLPWEVERIERAEVSNG